MARVGDSRSPQGEAVGSCRDPGRGRRDWSLPPLPPHARPLWGKENEKHIRSNPENLSVKAEEQETVPSADKHCAGTAARPRRPAEAAAETALLAGQQGRRLQSGDAAGSSGPPGRPGPLFPDDCSSKSWLGLREHS